MEIFEKEKNEGLVFLRILIKNIRLILIFVTVSTAITMIVTYLTPKKYESNAVIFPTESNSIDDVIRNPQFGYDIEADRLIQLLQSRSIMDSIIKRFNLTNYYEIDKDKPDWYEQLKKKYGKDIYFTRTPSMSIGIHAKTTKPEMSASIVNSIISLISSVREKLYKQNLKIAVVSLSREYYSLKNDLDSLNLLVQNLTRDKKNLKQFIQAERYISLVFDKTELENNESAMALQQLINQYNVKITWFYDVQNKLKNTRLMIERPLPSVYVVETAIPSYKKVFPSYFTNLMISLAASFLFISFLLFLLHQVTTLHNKLVK
jgi:uncharacterized protein involved in exopolysaccharide biosynthesis